MNWLKSAITNPSTGEQSAKSVALLLTVLVLAGVLIALIALACMRIALPAELASAITGVAAALAGISGTGYAVGKFAGAWSSRPQPAYRKQPDPTDKEGD